MPPNRVRHRRGSSLVEVSVCTLIVGVMLVPALNSVGAVLRSRNAATLHDGSGLSQQLLTEVLQAAYEDPESPAGAIGTDAGENTTTRADWDDVDDYHGWSQSPPTDKSGTAISYYTGWTRSVTVNWVDPNNLSTVVGSDQGLKKITVTAVDSSGRATEAVALRSNVGAMEQATSNSCPITYVTWADCRLQIGANSGSEAAGGIALPNHAQDQ